MQARTSARRQLIRAAMSRGVVESLEPRLLLSAYTFSTVGAFGTNQTGTTPLAGPIIDSAGNLYGTTTAGGAFGLGTIFEVAHGSSLITPLASFMPDTGAGSDQRLLIDGGGNLYGTSPSGGAFNDGTIFELPRDSSTIITLASFDGTNGQQPGTDGLVMDDQGDIFGATEFGGASGYGSIFELPHGSSMIETLQSFSQFVGNTAMIANGAGLILGTTEGGGMHNEGTIFQIDPRTSAISTVLSFDGTNGTYPDSDLAVNAAGTLFGMTQANVYELPQGATAVVSLAPSRGILNPRSLVADAEGNLFGTESYPGLGLGYDTVFEIISGTSKVSTVANLGMNVRPVGAVLDGLGNIYGLNQQRGQFASGTLFEIPQGSSAAVTVASFQDRLEGSLARAVVDASGNLFGVAAIGGEFGAGGIFQIPAGTSAVNLLASFAPGQQYEPVANLLLDGDGNLYGASDFGIYELPHGSSTIVSLASFPDAPLGAVIGGSIALDSSGNIYGTSNYGPYGNIFELPSGSSNVTILASFNGTDGSEPNGVVVDAEGNLFGITQAGGPNGFGNIFELRHGTSTIAPLAVFPSSNAQVSPPAMDSSGNIYCFASGIWQLPKGGANLVQLGSSEPGDNTFYAPAVDDQGDVFGMNGANIWVLPHGAAARSTVYSFASETSPTGWLVVDHSGDIFGTQTLHESFLPIGMYVLTAPAADTVHATSAITLTRDPDNLHIDWKTLDASGALRIDDPSGLTITDNSYLPLTLDESNGNPLPNVLHLNGTFAIEGAPGRDPLAGTRLDLGLSSIVYFAYTSAATDPLSAIRSDLQAGFNSSTWTGVPSATSGAITFSARAYVRDRWTLAYADAADGSGLDSLPGTVMIKPALIGDTNLDGTVNLADLLMLVRNFNGTNGLCSWYWGDFNYDGSVNASDFLALVRNFGARSGSVTLSLANRRTS